MIQSTRFHGIFSFVLALAIMAGSLLSCSNPAGNSSSTPVTGVSLNTSTYTMLINASYQLSATISPSNATNQSVTWASNNTAVATVSTSGLVTGVGVGTTTISATAADGQKAASCTVIIPADTWGQSVGEAIDSSGNIYMAGRVGTSSNFCSPCYWKNGTLNRLPLGSGNTYGKGSRLSVSTAGDVYISGWVGSSSSNYSPCLWRNGILSILSIGTGNTYFSLAGTTVDSSGNFYIAGCVGTSSDYHNCIPCYWENGTLTYLPLGTFSSTTMTYGTAGGIAFDPSGNLFISGWVQADVGTNSYGSLCYWKNGTIPVGFPNGTGNKEYNTPYDIAWDASGNIYIVGTIGPTTTTMGPAYWENSAETSLPMGTGNTCGQGWTLAIDSSNNVYIGGSVGPTASSQTPSYWKNGVQMALPFGSSGIGTSSSMGHIVCSVSGHVYITGGIGTASSLTPCFWEDGSLTNLPL